MLIPAYTMPADTSSRSTCDMSNNSQNLPYNVIEILSKNVLIALDLFRIVD